MDKAASHKLVDVLDELVTQEAATSQAHDEEPPAANANPDEFATQRPRRDPMQTLAGCERIVVVGRTGSGRTTLARHLATVLGGPHVELDALYFGPQFSTAPLALLRERTSAALAGDRWMIDGNKPAWACLNQGL